VLALINIDASTAIANEALSALSAVVAAVSVDAVAAGLLDADLSAVGRSLSTLINVIATSVTIASESLRALAAAVAASRVETIASRIRITATMVSSAFIDVNASSETVAGVANRAIAALAAASAWVNRADSEWVTAAVLESSAWVDRLASEDSVIRVALIAIGAIAAQVGADRVQADGVHAALLAVASRALINIDAGFAIPADGEACRAVALLEEALGIEVGEARLWEVDAHGATGEVDALVVEVTATIVAQALIDVNASVSAMARAVEALSAGSAMVAGLVINALRVDVAAAVVVGALVDVDAAKVAIALIAKRAFAARVGANHVDARNERVARFSSLALVEVSAASLAGALEAWWARRANEAGEEVGAVGERVAEASSALIEVTASVAIANPALRACSAAVRALKLNALEEAAAVVGGALGNVDASASLVLLPASLALGAAEGAGQVDARAVLGAVTLSIGRVKASNGTRRGALVDVNASALAGASVARWAFAASATALPVGARNARNAAAIVDGALILIFASPWSGAVASWAGVAAVSAIQVGATSNATNARSALINIHAALVASASVAAWAATADTFALVAGHVGAVSEWISRASAVVAVQALVVVDADASNVMVAIGARAARRGSVGNITWDASLELVASAVVAIAALINVEASGRSVAEIARRAVSAPAAADVVQAGNSRQRVAIALVQRALIEINARVIDCAAASEAWWATAACIRAESFSALRAASAWVDGSAEGVRSAERVCASGDESSWTSAACEASVIVDAQLGSTATVVDDALIDVEAAEASVAVASRAVAALEAWEHVDALRGSGAWVGSTGALVNINALSALESVALSALSAIHGADSVDAALQRIAAAVVSRTLVNVTALLTVASVALLAVQAFAASWSVDAALREPRASTVVAVQALVDLNADLALLANTEDVDEESDRVIVIVALGARIEDEFEVLALDNHNIEVEVSGVQTVASEQSSASLVLDGQADSIDALRQQLAQATLHTHSESLGGREPADLEGEGIGSARHQRDLVEQWVFLNRADVAGLNGRQVGCVCTDESSRRAAWVILDQRNVVAVQERPVAGALSALLDLGGADSRNRSFDVLAQAGIDAGSSARFAAAADARAGSVGAGDIRAAVAVVDRALIEVRAANETVASEASGARSAFGCAGQVDAHGGKQAATVAVLALIVIIAAIDSISMVALGAVSASPAALGVSASHKWVAATMVASALINVDAASLAVSLVALTASAARSASKSVEASRVLVAAAVVAIIALIVINADGLLASGEVTLVAIASPAWWASAAVVGAIIVVAVSLVVAIAVVVAALIDVVATSQTGSHVASGHAELHFEWAVRAIVATVEVVDANGQRIATAIVDGALINLSASARGANKAGSASVANSAAVVVVADKRAAVKQALKALIDVNAAANAPTITSEA